MALAIGTFVWAYAVGPGDFAAFAVICALSGMALGADLALPPALLARVIERSGHTGAHEGAYFGLWNFANKMNLALAAGLALPVLEALGYAPGARDAVGAGRTRLRLRRAALPSQTRRRQPAAGRVAPPTLLGPSMFARLFALICVTSPSSCSPAALRSIRRSIARNSPRSTSRATSPARWKGTAWCSTAAAKCSAASSC